MTANASYRVLTFDLTNARDREMILPLGVSYDGVGIRAVPLGVTIALGIGEGNDNIEVALGEWLEARGLDERGCPAAVDRGLFLTHPAGAGTLVLLVSTGHIAFTAG